MVVVVLGKIKWSGDFVLSDQGLGVAKVPFWFPCVLCCGISLPPDKEDATTGFSPVSEDCFNFVLFFTVY